MKFRGVSIDEKGTKIFTVVAEPFEIDHISVQGRRGVCLIHIQTPVKIVIEEGVLSCVIEIKIGVFKGETLVDRQFIMSYMCWDEVDGLLAFKVKENYAA